MGSSYSTSIGDELENIFDKVAEAFVPLMGLFFAIIAMNKGGALIKEQPTLAMATVWSTVLFFLVMVLVRLLRIHTRSFVPLCIIVLLGSVVSVLASFLISWSTGWFTLSLWVYFFAIIAFCAYQNAKKPPEQSSSAAL